MKPLRIRFKSGGFRFKQLIRNEKAVMYEKTSKEGFSSFEVFKIRTRKQRICGSMFFPEAERMPTGEDFGKWAFSCVEFDKAVKRFKQLGGSIRVPKRRGQFIGMRWPVGQHSVGVTRHPRVILSRLIG